jgi:transcriptional regulator
MGNSIPGICARDVKKSVGFKIIVTHVQTKKKLSQNRSEKEREVIIESFSSGRNPHEKEIAEMMRSLEI